jgi:hypothetical protein
VKFCLVIGVAYIATNGMAGRRFAESASYCRFR